MEMTFGEKIKECRKAQNLTQKQLADAIGAKHNSVSDWENNKNKPDPDTIELLCDALNITPNYLLKSSQQDFSTKEKQLIKKYRNLDTHGKKMVDFTLNEEWKRSHKLASKDTKAISSAKNGELTHTKESIPMERLLPDAAYESVNIEVTEVMKQHDEDIMNDENF